MSNRSSIHYKFKTENVNKVVTFDGNQIVVDELKRLIAKDEGINLDMFELSFTDDSTNKVYDEGFIPKNVVVVVRRLPKENIGKIPKVNVPEASGIVAAKPTQQVAPIHINEEIFSRMSEEERLAHINQVSALKYDPRNYGKPAMVGKASASYQCSKCNGFGHFPKQCPLAHIRRATGIPADELMETTPDNPNAYLHVSGKYVVPKIHEQAREQRKIVDKLTAQRGGYGNLSILSIKNEKIDIPEEYKCPICKEMMKNAVLVPCCGESFCLDCIENVMLQTSLTEEGSRCLCSEILRANSLYDNKSLRRVITKYQKENLTKVSSKIIDGSLSLAAKPVPITDNFDLTENLPPSYKPNESPDKLLDDYIHVVNPFDTIMPTVSTVVIDAHESPSTETTVSVDVQTAISFSTIQPTIPLIARVDNGLNDLSPSTPFLSISSMNTATYPYDQMQFSSSATPIPQEVYSPVFSESIQCSPQQVIPTTMAPVDHTLASIVSMESTPPVVTVPTMMPVVTMSSMTPVMSVQSMPPVISTPFMTSNVDDNRKAAFEEAKTKIWDKMVIHESLDLADWFPDSGLKKVASSIPMKRKSDEKESEKLEKRRREERKDDREKSSKSKRDERDRDHRRHDRREKETEKVEERKIEGNEHERKEKVDTDRRKRRRSKDRDERHKKEDRKEKKDSDKYDKDGKKSERRDKEAKEKKREKKEKKREKKEKREKEKKKDRRERERERSRSH